MKSSFQVQFHRPKFLKSGDNPALKKVFQKEKDKPQPDANNRVLQDQALGQQDKAIRHRLFGGLVIWKKNNTSQSSSSSLPDIASASESKAPKELQRKIDEVDYKKLAEFDPDFAEYAKIVKHDAVRGLQPSLATTELDIKHLPLIVEMENARNPGLNLCCFKSLEECIKELKEIKEKHQSGNYRIIYPPYKFESDHHMMLDVKLDPDPLKPMSIVLFEPSFVVDIGEAVKDLRENLDNPRISTVVTGTQYSDTDCVMFALNHALKSFKTYSEFAGKIHENNENRVIRKNQELPAVFFKHTHSSSKARAGKDNSQGEIRVNSEKSKNPDAQTLTQRINAYRTTRFNKKTEKTDTYSTSIEGFRLQEIKRVADYLERKSASSPHPQAPAS
ncbi:MAG TPA: YopJ family acetyltransferase [Noviherbaspirillum sp.]